MPNFSSDAETTLAQIRAEVLGRIHALESVGPGGVTSPVEAEIVQLLRRLDRYTKSLVRIGTATGYESQFVLAKKLMLHSPDARFCAVVRAMARTGCPLVLGDVLKWMNDLVVWKPLPEPVLVRWVPKSGTGYRPIVMPGPMRTAQALMVRDMLAMMNIDSPFDFTRKGAGGEKQLIANVCKDIENDFYWWWCPDIRDCFGSFRPGHFNWLPIDRRLLKNVMFLPKCAKVVLIKSEEYGDVLSYLQSTPHDLSVNKVHMALHKLTVQIVRQGLCQGSVLSPLLARACIRRVIEGALSSESLRRYSFFDDLNIGAQTKGEIAAARQQVTKAFSSLPAGPIELHDEVFVNAAKGRASVLGYRLQPGKGHGANYVHVKPGKSRTERFKAKLSKRLGSADVGQDPFVVAEVYREQWYASQSAWTKVPGFSSDVSRVITMSYVDDFKHGVPMGAFKV